MDFELLLLLFISIKWSLGKFSPSTTIVVKTCPEKLVVLYRKMKNVEDAQEILNRFLCSASSVSVNYLV